MQNRQHILQELQELSPLLADNQPVNPYAVPQGYFDTLAASVLGKIHTEEILASAQTPVYTIPQGYFEGLAGQILSRIKSANAAESELAEVAPLLKTISRKNVYSIPAGYFEQTDFASLLSQPAQKPARIITMRKANKLMQYATAAMMAGILVTGAFLFTDNKTNIDIENSERLDIPSELNKVSADELVTYLNNPDHAIAAPATTISASEAELVDVKDNISHLSDEELNEYLKENAGPFDAVPDKE